MWEPGLTPPPLVTHQPPGECKCSRRNSFCLIKSVFWLCYKSGWVLPPYLMRGPPIVRVSSVHSRDLDPGNRDVKQSEELATAKMQRNGHTVYSPTAVMTSDKIIQSPALLVTRLMSGHSSSNVVYNVTKRHKNTVIQNNIPRNLEITLQQQWR